MDCFIYEWSEGDEMDDETNMSKYVIRGYGINEEGQDVVVTIDDFPPYMYVELPAQVSWHPQKLEWKTLVNRMEEIFQRIRCQPPKVYSLQHKKKLYYYDPPEKAKYPFMFMAFPSKEDRQTAARFLSRQGTFTIFGKRIQIKCHEHEATPLLQFLSFRDLPSTGWVHISGTPEEAEDMMTYSDIEIRASYKKVTKPVTPIETIPPTRIISFDIEVNSHDKNKMPSAFHKDDVIFQISCIYEYKDQRENILLTLGSVQLKEDEFADSVTTIRHFDSEKALLLGYKQLIIEKNPHVLVGYNIFGFDIPYMMDRASFHNILHGWSMHGKRVHTATKEKNISWSSSAYQNQEFRFLELEGRIQIDLLPIIRRDYKLRNYKLATVSNHFLGSTKDPVTPKDIFTFYERGIAQQDSLGTRLMTCIGRYCLQDAVLVLDLYHKLQTWIGLIEMAKLCNTSIHALYTQGQQIKVFSQIYKICMYQQIVVESSMYHKNQTTQQYMGAYVFDPTPGIYDDVIPFDFSSLYPSVIMAYNIDYSTLVRDNTIPDDQCHVIEWKEEDRDYRFRFIKEPKGMLPALLEDLLLQRKKTKNQMKDLGKNSLMYTVLDKRQLAYKVSANSMYGAMGVTKGYLPFLPGAMCTTAKGRQSIQMAAEYVQAKHKGHLIYGDSVASYTPVYVRVEGVFDVLTVECLGTKYGNDVWNPCEEDGKQTKEYCELDHYYVETWTEKGWTRIRRLIRHALAPHKHMVRIVSRNSLVDVTDDHSLLTENGNPISPRDVKVQKTRLLHCPLPREEALELCMDEDLDVPMTDNTDVERLLEEMRINPRRSGAVYELVCFSQIEAARMLTMISTKGFSCSLRTESQSAYILTVNATVFSSTPSESVHQKERIAYQGYVYDLTTDNHHFAAGIGDLIVHNTDSIYCHFPKVPAKKLWNHALKVEKEFVKLFPNPMKLVFEEKMYSRFLIFTKKRYLALTQNQDLSIDKDLTIRGVLLARRDNCQWIRYIYENVVRKLMDPTLHISLQDMEYYLLQEFNKLFSHYWDASYVTISKAVGKDYKVKPCPGYDERTHQVTDQKKWAKRLDELNINWKSVGWYAEYKEKIMPAHAQLANKMKRRGIPVEAGARIEYLMTQHEDLKAKTFKKIEDPVYQRTYSDILKIDYLYVLHLAANPLDQLLEVCFKVPKFVSQQHDYRLKKEKLMLELESVFSPHLSFTS